jgi:hypothetical protein
MPLIRADRFPGRTVEQRHPYFPGPDPYPSLGENLTSYPMSSPVDAARQTFVLAARCDPAAGARTAARLARVGGPL